jgi:hypothetical protein
LQNLIFGTHKGGLGERFVRNGFRIATSDLKVLQRAWKIEVEANNGDFAWYPDMESMRYCFYVKPDAPPRNRAPSPWADPFGTRRDVEHLPAGSSRIQFFNHGSQTAPLKVFVHARRHVLVVLIRDVFAYHLRVQEAVSANAAVPLVEENG